MVAIARVRTVFTGVAGTPWYSNLYFQASPGTATQRNEAVRVFWGTLGNVIHQSIAFNVEAENAIIEDTTGVITGFESGDAETGVGLATGDPLPWATQGLIQEICEIVVEGRRLRGRTFVPGATETYNVNGIPTSDYRAQLQSSADALILASSTFGTWQVWSRPQGLPTPRSGTSDNVETCNVWNKWAQLRSRRD